MSMLLLGLKFIMCLLVFILFIIYLLVFILYMMITSPSAAIVGQVVTKRIVFLLCSGKLHNHHCDTLL